MRPGLACAMTKRIAAAVAAVAVAAMSTISASASTVTASGLRQLSYQEGYSKPM